MRSIGIDLSSAATGLVVLDGDGRTPKLVLEEEIVDKTLSGVKKQRAICTRIMTTIHTWKPDRIVVEGYSLNMKNTSSIVPLVELGGLLRFLLHLDGLTWYEPKATQVKKFAAGSGNSDKSKVMMHVLKRWGHESKSNNTADAYALAAIGLGNAGKLDGMTQEMYAIVMNLAARQN